MPDRSDRLPLLLVAAVAVNELRKRLVGDANMLSSVVGRISGRGLPYLLVGLSAAAVVVSLPRLRRRSVGEVVRAYALSPKSPRSDLELDVSLVHQVLEATQLEGHLIQRVGARGPSPPILLVTERRREDGPAIRAALSALRSVTGRRVEVVELGTRPLQEVLKLTSTPRSESAIRLRLPGADAGPRPPAVLLGYSDGRRPVRIPLPLFSKHVLLMGRTGSGKSTTAMALCERLWSDYGIPFLVLDHHNEYTGLVARLGGTLVGASGGPSLNVFGGVAANPAAMDIYVDLLRDALALTPSQTFIVHRCLSNALRVSPGEDPTLADLVDEISEYRERTGPEMESKLALLRRLEPLVSGEGRAHLLVERIPDLARLDRPAAMLLAEVRSDAVRDLLVHVILKRIYDEARSWGVGSHLRLVILVEEGERVLPTVSDERGATVVDKMLAELRKFGVGLVIITQAPHALSRTAMRNSAVKIIHALGSPRDALVIKPLLPPGISDRSSEGSVFTLRPGEAVVVMEGAPEPELCTVVPPSTDTRPLSPAEVAALSQMAPSFHAHV